MIDSYKQIFLEHLKQHIVKKDPKGLYDPIVYILELGGKRIRPILVLMAAKLFGGSVHNALNAALCIEVFHNFTLVHDDIMDDAPLRRGMATVHEKWDTNTAILSGDAMMIMAYQYLESYEAEQYKKLNSLFSKTAIEVCEGQQYDVEFELRNDVTIDEYIHMIRLKTSVLIGCALKMGAFIANASEKEAQKIYDFGLYLGIAFQLQDDYLDAFGDPKTFGKQVGGDILENKKTFLFIKALEKGDTGQKQRLHELYGNPSLNDQVKIDEVMSIFKQTGADKLLKKEIELYTLKAFQIVDTLPISADKKELFKNFGTQLMNRSF